MQGRPRPWTPFDFAFLTRPSIESLLDEFGAVGPLVIMALIGEAGTQIGGGKRDDIEVVAWKYAHLARRVRADAATVRAIVHAAQNEEIVEVVKGDGDRFELRLPKWREWYLDDPSGRERQQKSRRAKKGSRDSA